MNLLSSVSLLLALFLLPVTSVTEAAGEEVVETIQESLQSQEQSGDWRLLLVNRWNPMPEAYAVTLKKLPNGLQVDERVYDDLTAMLTDCGKAGLHPIVCSAYRDTATQTRLHQNKIARLRAAGYSRSAAEQEAIRWVAAPGTSEHQTGMAVDIVSASYQKLTHQQEKTAEQKWLMEHCWEYGFILRYPTDKSEVTGVGYEPWHYRYVGREAALAMRDRGLCLEEYMVIQRLAEAMNIHTETNQETAEAVS